MRRSLPVLDRAICLLRSCESSVLIQRGLVRRPAGVIAAGDVRDEDQTRNRWIHDDVSAVRAVDGGARGTPWARNHVIIRPSSSVG